MALPDTAAAHALSSDPADALFRALADPTRRRAVLLLARSGELCVCELTVALRVSQPKMSRHLAVLRAAGLVDDRRERVWIHYRLADDLAGWARAALDAFAAGCANQAPHADDLKRLARMPDRPGNRCRP